MGSKTYVNSVTQRLMQSKDFQTFDKIAIQKYIAINRQSVRPIPSAPSIAECMLDTMNNGLPQKFRAAYRYADKSDGYYFGKPNFRLTAHPNEDAQKAFIKYIETQTTFTPTVIEMLIGERNLYQMAWEGLIERYGYSGINNKFSGLIEPLSYLKQGRLYVTQATYDELAAYGRLDQIGLAMDYGTYFTRLKDTARIQPAVLIGEANELIFTYGYMVGTVVKEVTQRLPIDYRSLPTKEGENTPSDAEWVQVTYQVNSEYKWSSYLLHSGEIPELEQVTELPEITGNYYPRVYTRVDGQTLIDLPKGDERRKASEAISRKLGLNLTDMTTQIHEGIGDVSNDFRYIFMHLSLGINMDAGDELVADYLFKYFSQIYLHCPESVVIDNTTGTVIKGRRDGINQILEDKVYSQALAFDFIIKEEIVGSVLEVDKYSLHLEGTTHILRYQESKTVYTQISITGLVLRHNFGGHRVIIGADDENLTIPIDLDLLNSYGFKDREILINRGFQLTISTMKVIKTKWYQSGFFKVVMAAVSIAMNIFIPGTGFTLQTLISATMTTLVTGALVNLAVDALIKVAFKLGLSSEIIALVAAVATVGVAAYGTSALASLGNAKNLMMAVNKTVNIYQKALGIDMNNMRKEMEDFTRADKVRNKELQKAQELLNTGVAPPEMLLLSSPNTPVFGLGEAAEQFLDRSTTIDISSLSHDVILNYASMASSVYATTKARKLYTTSVEDVLLIN